MASLSTHRHETNVCPTGTAPGTKKPPNFALRLLRLRRTLTAWTEKRNPEQRRPAPPRSWLPWHREAAPLDGVFGQGTPCSPDATGMPRAPPAGSVERCVPFRVESIIRRSSPADSRI